MIIKLTSPQLQWKWKDYRKDSVHKHVQSSYFLSRLERLSLSPGPQGALGFCALNGHSCASTLESPVTTRSRQQTKISVCVGWGGGGQCGQANLCRESDQVSWECLSPVQGGFSSRFLYGSGGGWVTHEGALPTPTSKCSALPRARAHLIPTVGVRGHPGLCWRLRLHSGNFTLWKPAGAEASARQSPARRAARSAWQVSPL